MVHGVEQHLRSITSEHLRSFLHDTQQLDLAVNTYGNNNALACQ